MAAKTGTYTLISSNTLGSAAASVTFSSIPATYTDLVLVVNGSVTAGNPSIIARYNSDTGTNYSYTRLHGNGTQALSGRASNMTYIGVSTAIGITTTYETNTIISIQDYANTTTYKTCIARNNAASLGTETIAGLWRNTSAINNVTVLVDSSTFTAGSTFKLYGIEAGNL